MPSQPTQRKIVEQFASPRTGLLVTGFDRAARPIVYTCIATYSDIVQFGFGLGTLLSAAFTTRHNGDSTTNNPTKTERTAITHHQLSSRRRKNPRKGQSPPTKAFAEFRLNGPNN